MSDFPPSDKLETLFQQALDQPAASRSQWIDSHCNDDPELRRQLLALLDSHLKNEDGLLDGITADAFAEQVPTRIGKFRVVRLRGTGGMSAVFDAVHTDTNGRAAVKVIRVGLATARQRIRFQIESELLARLNHPGIAHLLDAGQAQVEYADGSTAPRMFIAMEFVDGQSITHHCSAHSLDVRERVELVEQVALAVQHAHETGVIHRDLKPANILVSGDGVPKVVDFGIARLIGAERQITMTGVIMGTPSYMSPEQMAGRQNDVSTRTDVYSLGAVLYELLSGKPPIEAPSALTPSAAFSMLHAEPARLMSLAECVPRDLDAVIHKALERNPDRRYPTARAFADDLSRWKTSQPVDARQPSFSDRLRLQFRRRPKVAVGVLVGLLSLMTLGSLAAWQAVRATKASRIAIEQRDEAVKQNARADKQTRIAEAVAAFLRDDVLSQASSTSQADSGADPDADIKVSAALDNAAARLDQQFKDDPAVEAEIRYTMGTTFRSIGKPAKAAEQFKRAVEINGGFEPQSAAMIDTRTQYACSLSDAGHVREAKELLKTIYADSVASLGEDHGMTIIALTNLTSQMATLNEYDQAIPLMQTNLEHSARALGPNHAETLTIRSNLAYCFSNIGRVAEAVVEREQILEICKATRGLNHPKTLLAMNNLATCYQRANQNERCIAMLREALSVSRKALGDDHPNTLTMIGNLAWTLDGVGQHEEALVLAREQYERQLRTMGPDHPDTLLGADILIDRLRSSQKAEEALALARSSYQIALRALEPNDTTTHSLGRSIPLALAQLGRLEEALTEARIVADRHVQKMGADNRYTLIAQDIMVQQLIALQRYAEAASIARDTFDRARKGDSQPRNTAKFAARLATCLDALGQPADAEAVRAATRPTTLPANR